MKNFNKINTIIFDMDGVLTDSERPYMDIFPLVCKEYNYHLNTEDIVNTLGTSYEYTGEYLKKRFGETFPYDELSIKFQEKLVEMAYQGKLLLKDGVLEILEYLKKNGYNIALASSNNRYSVYNYLKAFNIEHYFDSILTGDDVEEAKPNPALFLNTASILHAHASECMVIEDSINGLTAAKKSEMLSVMVPDLIPYNEQLNDLVDIKFDNLKEIILYLEQKENL